MKRLPDTELEVMKALWDSGPDTPRAALERALAPHGWAANTINTYLTRLADKGFLSARRLGRSNRYTPLVSREEYQRQEGKTILGKLYKGSLKRFAAALHDGGALDQSEVEELRAYLEEYLATRALRREKFRQDVADALQELHRQYMAGVADMRKDVQFILKATSLLMAGCLPASAAAAV